MACMTARSAVERSLLRGAKPRASLPIARMRKSPLIAANYFQSFSPWAEHYFFCLLYRRDPFCCGLSRVHPAPSRALVPAGAYAETCHIKPLGRPHDGPDVPENILCLCPNCHVLLDELAVSINDDHSIGGQEGLLRATPKHAISSEFLQYHRRMCGH